jgi:hypothetical protein
MSFGFGLGDFVTIAQVSKLAWDTFTAIKNAPKEWRALESEVQSLAISLKSLDDADTTLSIVQYTKSNPQREQNLRDLLTNSNNALAPMKELIEKYRVKDIDEKRDIRNWLSGAKFTFKTMSVHEFRNKLSLHTASLNIFLTTLTNTSLGRLEQLIISGQGGPHGTVNFAAGAGNDRNIVPDDGFDGVWSAIGRDLALGNTNKKSMTRDILDFREEIREYVQFIVSGGLPYSKHELSDRRRIRMTKSYEPEVIIAPNGNGSGAVPYSLDILDDMTTVEEDAELKTLMTAMVSFDGSSIGLEASDEDGESFDNPPSPSRSIPVTTETYLVTTDSPNIEPQRKSSQDHATVSSPSSQTRPTSHVRCDACNRELLVGEMYLHCKICQSSQKEEGYDVCDPCWEKGKSCPGKHRDERYFNHRERRIAEES